MSIRQPVVSWLLCALLLCSLDRAKVSRLGVRVSKASRSVM